MIYLYEGVSVVFKPKTDAKAADVCPCLND